MKYSEILLELNVANVSAIDQFVRSTQRNGWILPPQVQQWFKKQVRSWLLNNEELAQMYTPTDNDPQWMHDAVERGDELVRIELVPEIYDQIDHIIDWLRWLADAGTVEAQRILDKLPKLTVPMAIQKSEQWTEWLAKQAADTTKGLEYESGTITKLEFDDGYRFVQLVDEACYDREGKLMQHCVGSYFRNTRRDQLIYSLRDPQNNPHATLEARGGKITQIKGKQNKPPIKKYAPYIKEFILKFNMELTGDQRNIGLIRIDGIVYDIEFPNRLPKNIRGNLTLTGTDIEVLPDGMTIGGNLELSRTQLLRRLPNGLVVKGNINLSSSHIEQLPDDVKIGGDLTLSYTKHLQRLPDTFTKINGNLDLYNSTCSHWGNALTFIGGGANCRNSAITKLPHNLTINGSLSLEYSAITKLPDNLTIEKNLDVSNTAILNIPKNLTLGGRFKSDNSGLIKIDNGVVGLNDIPPGSTINDNLYMRKNTVLTRLPDNLTINGYVDWSDTKLDRLPRGLKVRNHLTLSGTLITHIPDDLVVGGELDISNTGVRHFPKYQKNLRINQTFITHIPNGVKSLFTSLLKLPDNLIIGELHLTNPEFSQLPKNLNCTSLYAADTDITHIPDDMVVTKNLNLHDTQLVYLPPNLKIGSLNVRGTPIAKFPKNLSVRGYLEFKDTNISEIPVDLNVGRLDLNGNKTIKKIPDNFTVGNLSLFRSKVKHLPKNLTVRRDLNIQSRKAIEKLPNDLKVGGYINMDYSGVLELPANFKAGSLDLRKTNISKIGPNLQVDGNVDLRNKHIQLGRNMRVGGHVDLKGAHLEPMYSRDNEEHLPFNMSVGGNLLIQDTALSYIGKDSPEAKAIKLKVGMRIYNAAKKPEKPLTARQLRNRAEREARIHNVVRNPFERPG